MNNSYPLTTSSENWYNPSVIINYNTMEKKKKKDDELKATHQGELTFGEIKIPVAVLGNRERVISVRGFSTFLGVKGGGAYWKLKRESACRRRFE